MKTYSIGRDLNCDIVINDSTDVISRRHALLNITSSGRMTLVDQSSNGTYVNGIRISPNVPVPVTRKDIISLAHVAKLDWNQIPKSNQWVMYVVGGIIAVAVIVGIIFGVKKFNNNSNDNPYEVAATELTDSTAIKQKEIARQDSIKNVEREDSIKKAQEKAKQDSIKAKEKNSSQKKDPSKSEGKDKSKDTKDKDKSKTKVPRAVG